MASTEQLQLSTFIKSIHQNLRDNAKVVGFDAAWQDHCAKEDTLKEYAEAMHQLATKHWQEHYNSDARNKSRIVWVHNCCISYFFQEGIMRQRFREKEIADKINLDTQLNSEYNCERKLNMLDVGSCYNPFKVFEEFEVFPIDIAPAVEGVYKCDFMNVKVVDYEPNLEKAGEVQELQECSFDVVLFSLLLEYLPCPKQRLLCCSKAYKLLKNEGLLIIITPDSKHVGANIKFMKSWRYHLALLGFSRIKYEKLQHIHCLAFRKSVYPKVAVRWADLQNKNQLFEQMFIPQDFNFNVQKTFRDVDKSVTKDINDDVYFLNELPNFFE